MFRQLICALALCVCGSLSAHATTWQFSYRGFQDGQTGVFDPAFTVQGWFAGSDNDHDGAIDLGELSEFHVGWGDVLHCPNAEGNYCSVQSFRYLLSGTLAFEARLELFDEAIANNFHWITGDRFVHEHWLFSESWTTTMYWTDATVFTIWPPPVPEPAPAAMGLAGALALGAAAGIRTGRRRRAGGPPPTPCHHRGTAGRCRPGCGE